MLQRAGRDLRRSEIREGETMSNPKTRHGDSGGRMSIDTDLVGVTLSDDSFRYMVDMLNEMPHAKAYRGAEFDPTTHDIVQVIRDFVAESEPKGSLEAEPLVIVDAVARAEGGYLVRGDARLAASLTRADVPDVVRAAG
jgi:hypothetical protein